MYVQPIHRTAATDGIPKRILLIQIKSEQTVKTRGCQENRPLILANLLAVIQVLVLADILDFETAVVPKQLIASCNQDISVAECDATQTPVATAALEVNLALVPVDSLLDFLFLKVNRIYAAVTLPLLAASHDRCCYERW